MNPYVELGVDRGADEAAIKKAYRTRAHKAHPDKGGDAEKFHAIQKSYEILTDPERRKRFDDNGETGQAPDKMTVALGSLANILLQVIDAPNVSLSTTDLRELVSQNVQAQIAQLIGKKRDVEKLVTRRETALKRFKRAKKGDNMLQRIIEGDIRQKRAVLDDIDRNMEIGTLMLKILSDYSYDFERAAPSTRGSLFGYTARGLGQ